MTESARQCANDLESKLLPEPNRRFVSGNDEIELHRAKAQPARFIQAMLAHRATDPLPARARRDHKGGVSNMRTAARLVRPQNVSPNYATITWLKT